MDLAPEMVTIARANAERAGLSDRVRFEVGDLHLVYGRFAPCLLALFGRRMANHTAGTSCGWMRQACLRLGRTNGAVAA